MYLSLKTQLLCKCVQKCMYISYTKTVENLILNVTEVSHALFSVQSNLEFNVRMQEFVELVRRGEKMEAVR